MTSEELFEKWFYGPEAFHVKEEYRHVFSREYKNYNKAFKAGMKAVLDGLPEKKTAKDWDYADNRGFNAAIDEIREKFREINK